jgi:ABC-type antimicrobial peptide transport system permease subunit
MSQNEAAEDYIFPTNNAAPIDVSPINIGLKMPPLRSISTNLDKNKEHLYEEINDDYARKNNNRPNAPSINIYDYLDFAPKKKQIKSSFFKNRKKLILFISILFVIAIVAIIAMIMIVLATASKRIKNKLKFKHCIVN